MGSLISIILYITEKGSLFENTFINKLLDICVNIARSAPFIIIIILAFPLSRLRVGTSIGSTAAIVPLSIASTPFVARIILTALQEVNKGVIEAALSMGASNTQIIAKVLLPEAAPSLVSSITITIISIIGYSAMAGVIGGGGLGDLAYRYGYQKFRTDILIITLIIMIALVQVIQIIGSLISKKLNKK
jgi:D-methionine transport system permease protein